MKIRHLSILMIASLLPLFQSCKSKQPAVGEIPAERESGTVIGLPRETSRALEHEARKWLGVKYRYGGETRKGTDCSGMIMSVYRDVTGLKLPRNSAEQQAFCKRVDRKRIAPGDLVFFTSSKKGRVTHVGLYIGDDKFIHASSSRGVIISSLSEPYYVKHYHSVGRVPGLGEGRVTITSAPVELAERPVDDRDDIYITRKNAKKNRKAKQASTKGRRTPQPAVEPPREIPVELPPVELPEAEGEITLDSLEILTEIRRAF